MALIASMERERRFGVILPGRPGITPFSRQLSDESIWNKVSGEWKELSGVPHVLYRHAGILYVRIGDIEHVLRPDVRASMSRIATGLRLKLEGDFGEIEVVEIAPDWLLDDPIMDHMQAESQFWTYLVYSVISGEAFWSAEL
jgi:hypothetical protein